MLDIEVGIVKGLPSNAQRVWIDAYEAATGEDRVMAGWAAVRAAGWRKEDGAWRKVDKRLPDPEKCRAAIASLALLNAIAKAHGGWSKQPRVPSGPKGGQWTAGGFGGAGGGGATIDPEGQGSLKLKAPHLGLDSTARQAFGRAEEQQAFIKPLTDAEITGEPAFLGNPHGYVLKHPSEPTDIDGNRNPDDVATYVPGVDPGEGLNGIPFVPWAGPAGGDWTKVEGQGDFAEPPLPNAGSKRLGAGVIIKEPDGRIWTVDPLNQFGGYKETFPKGGIEPGLNLRQTAIKEAWEESGLKVKLTGFLGDFERTTSVARYYTAERVGGDPTDAHWETQGVNLVPLTELPDRVVHHADAPILAALSGENVSVQKALCVLADLIDMNGPTTPIAKAKGGAWQKQLRVPAGLPTGGQWTTYGAGGIGAAYAAGGKALELQKHGGTGPQSEALNAKIQVIQDAANQSYLHPSAAKLLAGPMPKQTYSQAAWQSAAEAKAYVDAGGMDPDIGKVATPSPSTAAAPAAASAKPDTLHGMTNALGDVDTAPRPPSVNTVSGDVGTVTNPLKLGEMQKVAGKPGGSALGGTYVDANGQKWIVKSYTSAEMAMNEVASSKVYNALGIATPVMKLIDVGDQYHGGIGVASKFMDDVKPFDVNNPAHVAAAQAEFGAHALLANWDAMGASFDNMMIRQDGTPVMIDPGGAMLYRAQGAPKAAGKFGTKVVETSTMRDPATNPTAAKIFGPMTDSAIAESANMAASIYKANDVGKVIDEYLPKKTAAALKATMLGRADDLAQQAAKLNAAQATSTAMDITKTGTTTGMPTHPNPAVQAMIGKPSDTVAAAALGAQQKINAAKDKLSGDSKPFYEGQMTSLDDIAGTGDVDAVLSAFYQPKSAKAKASANYGEYLKAHAAAIEKAQAVAAAKLQAAGKPGDGTLVTGGNVQTPATVAAAKNIAQTNPIDPPATQPIPQHVTATVPKPQTPAAPAPLPALPSKPKMVTPGNPAGKLSAKVDKIEELSKAGTPEAMLEIQAISLTITGTNTYSKKAKQYAADTLAALGGQAKIDALPSDVKKAGFDAGLDAAAAISKTPAGKSIVEPGGKKTFTKKETIGGIEVTNTYEVAEFNPADVPQFNNDYLNWNGTGSGLSKNHPEWNIENNAVVKAMTTAAMANDFAAVLKIDASKSQYTAGYKANLTAYFQEVIGKPKLVHTEYPGGTSPKEIIKGIAAKAKTVPISESGAKQIGGYLVISEPGLNNLPLKASMPHHQYHNNDSAVQLHAQSKAAADTPAKKAAIKAFTSNASYGLCENLRSAKVGSSLYKEAKKLADDANAGMIKLPEGVMITRTMTLSPTFTKADLDNVLKSEGKVLQDPSPTSWRYDITDPWHNSSDVIFVGVTQEGARGSYAGVSHGKSAGPGLSSYTHERELLMAPSSRFYVQKVWTAAEWKAAGKSEVNVANAKHVVEVINLEHSPEDFHG